MRCSNKIFGGVAFFCFKRGTYPDIDREKVIIIREHPSYSQIHISIDLKLKIIGIMNHETPHMSYRNILFKNWIEDRNWN